MLGRGTAPEADSVGFSVRRRVPGNAPPGTYEVTLLLVNEASGETCSSAMSTVTVAPADSALAAGGTAEDAASGTALVAAAPPEDDLFGVAAALTAALRAAGPLRAEVVPNPSTGRTTIRFALSAGGPVRLVVYDVLGREVAVLVDGHAEAGTHEAAFDGSALPAGAYLYRLTVGREVVAGRMTLAR